MNQTIESEKLLSDLNCNGMSFSTKIFDEMMKKKNDLIQQKLIEKGYGWINNLPANNRFNRLCLVRKGDWEYYFADNRTSEGEFIVAISDFRNSVPNFQPKGNLTFYAEMKISFDYTDDENFFDKKGK